VAKRSEKTPVDDVILFLQFFGFIGLLYLFALLCILFFAFLVSWIFGISPRQEFLASMKRGILFGTAFTALFFGASFVLSGLRGWILRKMAVRRYRKAWERYRKMREYEELLSRLRSECLSKEGR